LKKRAPNVNSGPEGRTSEEWGTRKRCLNFVFRRRGFDHRQRSIHGAEGDAGQPPSAQGHL